MTNKEDHMKIPYEMRGEPMEFVPPEEDPEPLFLERKHVKFIVLWGAAVTCVLGAVILERFFL
jgi:hypothetical protein